MLYETKITSNSADSVSAASIDTLFQNLSNELGKKIINIIRDEVLDRFDKSISNIPIADTQSEFFQKLLSSRYKYRSRILVGEDDQGYYVGVEDGLDEETGMTYSNIQRAFEYGTSQSPPCPHMLLLPQDIARITEKVQEDVMEDFSEELGKLLIKK